MHDAPRLRPATPEDRDLLRSIFLSSWDRALALSPLPEDTKTLVLHQQFDLQDQSYHARYPHADFDLVFVGEEPAGRLYVDRGPELYALLDITLLPAFRGRGLGTVLMRELLAEARAAGRPVRLHVEHWNPDARRLYHRLGFTDTIDTGSHWMMMWSPD